MSTPKVFLHNTVNRSKEEFHPLDAAGKGIGLYVCGPTVYDLIHIGNARPLVVFDVLARLLRHLYPKVTYVRNITDIDDKINARAAENGETIRALTDRTIVKFHADAEALRCDAPDIEPRATDHVVEMIELSERLIAAGHAYAAEGHVLFDVPSWPDYGKFSGRDRDEQISGARVEVAPYKRDPADFVLWKPSGEGEPGWDSPWGYGRPGWHVECSAMSSKYLGVDFDIHGGGLDLIFPHHQNEVAQSCCGNAGSGFARYWMHNGYLMSEGEKMSKSLGNFYTVRELLDELPGEALRLVLLKSHYRQPMDFSKEKGREAKSELDRFYGAVKDVDRSVETTVDAEVVEALSDDLNTPRALARLHSLTNAVYQGESGAAATLLASAKMLGLLQQDPEHWFKGEGDAGEEGRITALIEERVQAKKAKDFARADQIRDDLAAEGIILEDKPGGVTEWRKA